MVEDQWNILAFYDGALLDITDSDTIGVPNPTIQSAGIGVVSRISDYAHARASYGWVLDTQGFLFGEEAFINDGKMHFGVTITY